MKRLIFFIIIASLLIGCNKQQNKATTDAPDSISVNTEELTTTQKRNQDSSLVTVEDNELNNEDSEDKIFDVVDKPPFFHGGDKALYQFLTKNIKYPTEAQDKNIQGKVICQFIVEKDGSISNVKLIKGVNPLLDNEAIRVIKAMPKWEPGMLKGKPVRVKYSLPVTFKLS